MPNNFKQLLLGAGIGGVLVTAGVLFSPRDGYRPIVPGDAVSPGFAQTSTEGRSIAADLSEAFESAANRVGPSVVPIYAEKTVEVDNDVSELFRRFFGERMPDDGGSQTLRSVGSGVIARKDGYILTNNHVVADARRLTVILEDGERHEAKVVGRDPPTDLAVIKIDENNLPVAQFGTSQDLRVGQWVIAVGNPFQLLHSVTAGIVSAMGRNAVGITAYEDFIQTDASINPGNSGGALADLDGRVVGINTAISSMTGMNAGVGFAIPIDMAKGIMDELISEGGITRGYLAVLPQDITEDLARALKLRNREGALVGGVTPGGPGDKGGMERGDVIIEFDGKKVKDSAQLRAEVARADPNETVKVVVIREGKTRTLNVKLGERPTETSANVPDRDDDNDAEELSDFGLSVQDVTPAAARQLNLGNERGALVVSVRGGSPAADAGITRGDLIVEVDGTAIRSAEDADEVLTRLKSKQSVAVLIRRGESTFYVPLEKG